MCLGELLQTPLISTITGGLIAVAASWVAISRQFRENRKRDLLAMRSDVLRRFIANRHFLTPKLLNHPGNLELFVALNEIFMVFADNESVIKALKEAKKNSWRAQDIKQLIEEMAKAVNIAGLDGEFIEYPFVPPGKVEKSKS